jgi:ribose 5-phosphate isomerase B
VRIAVASDHGGLRLKNELVARMRENAALKVDDLGTHNDQSTDYPDYAHLVASRVASGRYDRGILVCGTGVGMSIAANRHPGIRCVCCSDVYTAKLSRQHNDANVLAIGERVLGIGLAWQVVTAWLEEPADPDPRHLRRREKIERP